MMTVYNSSRKDTNQQTIRELTNICTKCRMTMLLAWSQQDAALYLETLKQFEHKPPDALLEQFDSNHFSRLTRTLTCIKSVNKTDVLSLVRLFRYLSLDYTGFKL